MIDLMPEHAALIRSILQHYIPHRTVWAFGSRVNGKVKPFSDIDLAIMGQDSVSPEIRLHLQEAFNNALLPMKVDLVEFHTLPMSLQQNIQQHHAVFFKGEAA